MAFFTGWRGGCQSMEPATMDEDIKSHDATDDQAHE
jgi:hypothetical protein